MNIRIPRVACIEIEVADQSSCIVSPWCWCYKQASNSLVKFNAGVRLFNMFYINVGPATK